MESNICSAVRGWGSTTRTCVRALLTARATVGMVAIWRLAGEHQTNAEYQHEQSTDFSHCLFLFATQKLD